MLLGYNGEAEIIQRWQRQFGIPIFTSGTNQVAAMKALRVKKFVGIGYDFDDTSIVARYFNDAGFEVLELEKLPGPWEEVGRLSSKDIYYQAKRLFLRHPHALVSVIAAHHTIKICSNRRDLRHSLPRLIVRRVDDFLLSVKRNGCARHVRIT